MPRKGFFHFPSAFKVRGGLPSVRGKEASQVNNALHSRLLRRASKVIGKQKVDVGE
jgi:hypothetical protein